MVRQLLPRTLSVLCPTLNKPFHWASGPFTNIHRLSLELLTSHKYWQASKDFTSKAFCTQRWYTVKYCQHLQSWTGNPQQHTADCTGRRLLARSPPGDLTWRRFVKSSSRSPTIMKMDTPEFHAIFTAEVRQLIDLFQQYGYTLRLAGGPVRDLLLDIIPHDLDFATTATPAEMQDMFTKENIRMINRQGEKHGTVTCRINDKVRNIGE